MVRSKLYELLVNCLPPELILRTMSQELMAKLDDQLKHKCTAAAAQYEHRLQVLCFETACLDRGVLLHQETLQDLKRVKLQKRGGSSFEMGMPQSQAIMFALQLKDIISCTL